MFLNALKPLRLKVPYLMFLRLTPFRNYSNDVPANIKVSRIGSASDYKAVSQFLLDNYFPSEPMGVVLGFKIDDEILQWFPKYIKAQFVKSPPVSAQAVDKNTGKIVGINFAIVSDPSQGSSPSMMDYFDPATQPIQFQITSALDDIQEGLNAAELLGLTSLASADKDPKILDNLMICVHKNYLNQGISSQLIKKTEESARKVKDCHAAKTITTTEYGYKAYLKRRYQCIREIKFADYYNSDGVKIFEGKMPEFVNNNFMRYMIKDISVKDTSEGK